MDSTNQAEAPARRILRYVEYNPRRLRVGLVDLKKVS